MTLRPTFRFKLFRFFARALFSCVFRWRVVGLEHVPKTPYIACVNHLGWAEGIMLMLFFPTEPLLHALGERDVMERAAWRRWLWRQLPLFLPLDRAKPREALRMMQDVLERGGALGIAPEGKLGTQEGTIGELQDGAAYLSIRTGAPLLPVGATGTLELWFRKELTLRVGEPIVPEASAEHTRARTRALTAQLDTAMRALLPGDTQSPRYKPLRNFLTKLL
jgi:1-acyl-sn-glycerol-3-phosphate acyltransferase